MDERLNVPRFYKYQRLGNDYVVMDHTRISPDDLTPGAIRLICDPHFGVGSDGILIRDGSHSGNGHRLRIFNPDGSEAEKSGNGIAIFSKFLRDQGYERGDRFSVITRGGAVPVEVETRDGRVESVTSDIGRPEFGDFNHIELEGRRIEVTPVSLGNPHCVVVVPRLEEVNLQRLGPLIEGHSALPKRTNVQFAEVVSDTEIRILIWERGVGETLASGTSSCAAVAVCHWKGLVGREVSVRMRGGALSVSIDDAGSFWLSGPVEEVCNGELGSELMRRISNPRPE